MCGAGVSSGCSAIDPNSDQCEEALESPVDGSDGVVGVYDLT